MKGDSRSMTKDSLRAYVYVYDSMRKISILYSNSSGDQWRELISTIDKAINRFNVKQAKKEKEG